MKFPPASCAENTISPWYARGWPGYSFLFSSRPPCAAVFILPPLLSAATLRDFIFRRGSLCLYARPFTSFPAERILDLRACMARKLPSKSFQVYSAQRRYKIVLLAIRDCSPSIQMSLIHKERSTFKNAIALGRHVLNLSSHIRTRLSQLREHQDFYRSRISISDLYPSPRYFSRMRATMEPPRAQAHVWRCLKAY